MMGVFLCLLVLLNTCVSASVNPTGIVASRKPVLIERTNSAEIPMPTTSTKPVKNQTKTIEAPSPTEDAEETVEPTETTEATVNPKASDSELATPTNNPSSSTDPTDYSTVWPTRWRPRRRFGAQSEAPPQFNPNWKLIVFILISVILL